jgi:NAD(P)-dependent dehydrogenase (short-subunit alcohol dehydrogenase family)
MAFSIRFDNKRAVVTGATGHIGRAFCREFAELGGTCLLVDRDGAELKKLMATLRNINSSDHSSFVVDLVDAASRSELLKEIHSRFNRVDLLVNNAAYTGDSNLDGWAVPFEDQSVDAWQPAMEVNLSAAFDLTQGLLPLLKKGVDPSIINIASIYGLVGPDTGLYTGTSMGNPLAYAASKGGLLQMTKWLASVLAPDVRVNAVSPGGVFRSQPEAFVQRYIDKTPLGRMATETDVAGSMVFLASDLASYLTGQNIVVDGGFTVR